MKEEEGWERGRDIVLRPIKKGKVEFALSCSRFTSRCPLRPGTHSDLTISSLLCVVPPWGRTIRYQLHACRHQLCPDKTQLHSPYTERHAVTDKLWRCLKCILPEVWDGNCFVLCYCINKWLIQKLPKNGGEESGHSKNLHIQTVYP